MKNNKLQKKLLVFNLILFLIVAQSLAFFREDRMKISFLDVGQGDSIFIQTPDKKNILVDGGPDTNVLSKLSEVLPYWQRNIDLLILTHPDLDHVGGLPEVIKNYQIQKIVYDDIPHNSSQFNEFSRLIEDYGIEKVEYLNRNIRVGCCVYFDFLWPRSQDISHIDPNDRSISFELVYGDTNFLFAGDLTKTFEDKLLERESFLDVDLLKVSHHGSKTSTDLYFLDQIKPEFAVISAGRDNRFGHPHVQVLDNLLAKNIEIFRTDLIGTIKIYSDGNEIMLH